MDARPVPGPTGVPLLGTAVPFARDSFGFVKEALAEYGSPFKTTLFGTDLYVLGTPEHLREALVTKVDSFGKTSDFRTAFGEGLLTVEGETWREQRELLGPYFYRERIEGYAETMVERTERRLADWRHGDRIDAEEELSALALEILFSTLFGRDLTVGGDDALRASAEGLNGWVTPTSWVLPEWVPTPARRRFRQSVETLHAEIARLLAERERAGADGDDLLSALVRAREHTDIPERRIKDQLVTFIFAGHETTAKAMTFTLYFLARNPDVRERVEAELAETLDGRTATAEDVGDLPVLDRALRESMRVLPPVHTIPRRTTEDVTIGGYHIPEGREVHLSVYGLHRNPDIYDDPERFRPARWNSNEYDDFAYLPFGGGRRSCLGREFALLEAKLVLGTLCSRYRLEWAGDGPIELDPKVTTGTDGGAPMVVHKRE